MLRHRRRVSWIALVVCVVLAFGAGMALQQVRSPAQAALDAAAPPRSLLTATASTEVVSTSVVGRGTVTASQPVDVPLPAVEGRPIVSATPVQVGETLTPGQVLVELSGRPVIVLEGPVPAYRDLRPGDKGPDVTQLQRALTALGHRVTIDGVFGEGTKSAVRALYAKVGYPVPATTGIGEPADPDVALAEETARQVQHAVEDMTADPQSSGVDLARAQEDLGAAKAAVVSAKALGGPVVPMSEVVFVPAATARLTALSAGVGQTPTDPLATLDAGALVVVAAMVPAVGAEVSQGMPVTLQSDAGWSETGTVSSTSPVAAEGDDASASVRIQIEPAHPLPSEMTGHSLKVVVTTATTDGPVLAVPIAAITASADGSTYVVRLDADGTQSKVQVLPGLVGDLTVEVTCDGLASGDTVVTSQ